MLHDLQKITTRKKKILGRGYGSGKGGHTVGRGTKGQAARVGYSQKLGFEGGQLPLYRRLPRRRGWGNKPVSRYFGVNLSSLEKAFKEGEVVSPDSLVAKSVVPQEALKPRSVVKILSRGELSKKLSFEGVKFSKAAQAKLS